MLAQKASDVMSSLDHRQGSQVQNDPSSARIGAEISRMLNTNFGEFQFHALR
jgi:hypothetical protein